MSEKNYRTDNKSFIVYKDWEEYVNMLDNEQTGMLFKALFAFASRGEETSLDGMSAMAFAMMRQAIDRDGLKWEKTCIARSKSIKKRWEKQNDENTNEYKSIQRDTDKDTDKDKEKDNKKEMEYEKERQKDTETGGQSVGSNVGQSVIESNFSDFSEGRSVGRSDEESEYDLKDEFDYSEARITDNELKILYDLADIYIIDGYLRKIRKWQRENRKFISKPYETIRKWLDQDGVLGKARPYHDKTGYKSESSVPPLEEGRQYTTEELRQRMITSNGIDPKAYEEYAASIDFDKLSV